MLATKNSFAKPGPSNGLQLRAMHHAHGVSRCHRLKLIYSSLACSCEIIIMSADPVVTFERSVVLVHSSLAPESPWRAPFSIVDGIELVMLKNEMHYTFKRLSGLPRNSGMEWATYFDDMAEARDARVTKYIKDALATQTSDSPLPTSFQDAYYWANVPKIIDVDMPGYKGSLSMNVLTSSRTGVTVSVQLTPENMAHIFANVKYYGQRATDEPSVMHDEQVEGHEDGDDLIKKRVVNGKPTLRVQYRDSSGAWRTKSAQCQDGMTDVLRERLTSFYATNHHPEDMPLPADPPCSQSESCEADEAAKAKHTNFWKRMKFLK